MQSGEHDMAITTNSTNIAEEFAMMTRGVTLHEALEKGAGSKVITM